MSTRRDGYDIRKWTANAQGKRRRHRALPYVLAAILLIELARALFLVLDPTPPRNDFSLPLLPLLIAAFSPFARDTWLTGRGRDSLDEFERDALARATLRAFSVFLLLVLATFSWIWLASLKGWEVPRHPGDWSAIGWALVMTGAVLPILFAEWMVPFPPAGDDWED